jgi:hypothetical protein
LQGRRSSAEQRVTNRIGRTGKCNKKICSVPTKKADEKFFAVCRLLQGEQIWKISAVLRWEFGQQAKTGLIVPAL